MEANTNFVVDQMVICKFLEEFRSNKEKTLSSIFELANEKDEYLVEMVPFLCDIIIDPQKHAPSDVEGSVLGMGQIFKVLHKKTKITIIKTIHFLRDYFLSELREDNISTILLVMNDPALDTLPRLSSVDPTLLMFREDIAGYFRVTTKGILGRGTYGTVYKGYHRKTAQIVAIKCLEYQKISEKGRRYLQSEIDILTRLNEERVVKLLNHTYSDDGTLMYIIMEYCPLGDLAKFISQNKGNIPIDQVKHFFKELALSVYCLKERSIIHRDLKPANILLVLDESGTHRLKLCDFTFARELDQEEVAHTMCGSPLYMAPERLESVDYNVKAELWSIGIIYYELLYNTVPWKEENLLALHYSINSTPLQFPSAKWVPGEMKDLIRQLLKPNPKERIGWEEYLKNPLVGIAASPRFMESIRQQSEQQVQVDVRRLGSPQESLFVPVESVRARDDIEEEVEDFVYLKGSIVQRTGEDPAPLKGHSFRPSSSKFPTFCVLCSLPLVGLFVTRVQCADCLYSAHAACAVAPSPPPRDAGDPCACNPGKAEVPQFNEALQGHRLAWSAALIPRYCEVCKGWVWAGPQCSKCALVVHYACIDRLPKCNQQ